MSEPSVLSQKTQIIDYIFYNIRNSPQYESHYLKLDDALLLLLDRELSLFNDFYSILKINNDNSLGEITSESILILDDYDYRDLKDVKGLLYNQSITYLSMFKSFLQMGGTTSPILYKLKNDPDLSHDNRKELIAKHLA